MKPPEIIISGKNNEVECLWYIIELHVWNEWNLFCQAFFILALYYFSLGSRASFYLRVLQNNEYGIAYSISKLRLSSLLLGVSLLSFQIKK